MRQSTLQEIRTTLAPDAVLDAAEQFFARNVGIYAAFPDMKGPTFRSFRGQGNEEIVIGVVPLDGGGTLVRGSTMLYDMQVGRFFSTLPPASAVPVELPATADAAKADAAKAEATR